MSSQNFELLGNYIQPCNERNVDCIYGADELRGINNEGKVIPSKANLVGVSFHTYKIAHKGDFIYNPARLDIGSISCLQEESAIFSQMYVVFKVREEYKDVLLTEYLWLWLKRENFFRYVAFINFGSVREMFTYEDMCNVMLPIPPIAEQRRIVSEYQTVERRIANNEALIQKLEETAQAIYHHTFVEGIDEEKLPEGWRMGTLGEIMNISSGKTVINKVDSKDNSHIYPVIGASGIIGFSEFYNKDKRILTTGRVGTLGVVNRYDERCWAADNVLIAESNFYDFSYLALKSINYQEISKGGVQALITQTELKSYPVVIPKMNVMAEFSERAGVILHYMDIVEAENLHLRTLLTLLTSKLA